MSETCIVCLGDLGGSANELPRSVAPGVEVQDDDQGPSHSISTSPAHGNSIEAEMIAHLLPCGHNLHNDCLKPWVERANSCPICRQSFNQVELSYNVGSPVISSYLVDDRTQIADIDPSMFIDDLDNELDTQPCPICDIDDNEDELFACDGCGTEYHTYCMDLTILPPNDYLCKQCATDRALEAVIPPARVQRPQNRTDRQIRGQQRLARTRNQATSSGWARVWQTVWDRLNFDLDFPFDEASSSSHSTRTHQQLSQRRDFRQWEIRFQVAERQGGANRFRDAASTLLDLRTPRERSEPTEPESQEEIRAWNVLEKAKEISRDPGPNKRKRKSASASPSDAEPVPRQERPLKRPRTRRTLDHAEVLSDTTADAPTSRRNSAAGSLSARHTDLPDAATQATGPSFLQSLLKEVEASAAPEEGKGQTRLTLPSNTGHSSPQVSSPGASPAASNHASPRALSTTPPPFSSTRPGSPINLSSRVEPIFPKPEFSPMRLSPEASLAYRTAHDARQPRPRKKKSPGPGPLRSTDNSPSRITMSLSAKSDLQKMVSLALKPHYKDNAISKDQYTEINRNISRMLYDKVGDSGSVISDARESWERLASDEVAKAVQSLKLAST